MSEKDTKNLLSEDENSEEKQTGNVTDFPLEDFKLNAVSSAETLKNQEFAIDEKEEDILSLKADLPQISPGRILDVENPEAFEKEISDDTEDPIFKELSEPKLPELKRENRARLQIQSPTKIFFYWSFQNNPFQTLNRVFGGNTGSYTLVLKIVNQSLNLEEIVPIEAEGSTWFDAEANSKYKAEIGFYATDRPFVRVLYSNTVETPRKNPSSRRDYSAYFDVSANQFAQVLDDSGYKQDAVEVALAGDDAEYADFAAKNAFAQITETNEADNFTENYLSDVRFALLALASGYSLEKLRHHISKRLFEKLQENAGKLSRENTLSALQKNFGEYVDEIVEEEQFGSAVFGASLVNFPKTTKRRVLRQPLPKFSPLSSFALR